MNDFKNFDNEEMALYIAKMCDLKIPAMKEVKELLDNKNATCILDRYSEFLAPAAIDVIKQNCSTTPVFEYYEIENTKDEWSSRVSGRYATEEIAREALKDKSDWYRPNGTGTIYKVSFITKANGEVDKYREEIYRSV